MSDAIVGRKTVIPGAPLSESRPHVAGAATLIEFLAFVVANEFYALPLQSVREILKSPPITEVPRAPTDVLGIISVRGRVTTVLDLRRRLHMPESPVTKHTRVLLVDGGHEVIGLFVDAVLQVYRLREEEIELATAVGGDMAEYVMGIGRPKTVGRSPERARRAARAAGARREERSDEPTAVFEPPVDKLGAPARAEDILILFDPIALLRRT